MLTVWCGFGREGIAIILLFVGFFLERVLLAAAVLDRQQQLHERANCDRINTRRKRDRYLRHADLYASTGNSEHHGSYPSQV